MSYDFRLEPCPGGYECRKDDELQRLTRERDEAREQAAVARVILDGATDLLEAVEDERDAAERKVEKLLAALSEMIDTQDRWEMAVGKIIGRQTSVFTRAIDRARAALAETETK